MYSLFPLLFANTNILTEKRVNVETIDGLPLLYKKKVFYYWQQMMDMVFLQWIILKEKKSGEADG